MPANKRKKRKNINRKTDESSSSCQEPKAKQMKTKNKIDESSSSCQEPKAKKMETKNKIDETCSSENQVISTTLRTITPSNDDYMNIKSGDFKDIRFLRAFVDKTLLIKNMITKEKYASLVLIAPRRFGKSVNLSMLAHFFEILPDQAAMTANRELFKNLDIEKEEAIMEIHQGKWPVILLDFRCDCCVDSRAAALEFIRRVVHKAYERHAYLCTSKKLSDSQKRIVNRWCDDDDFKNIPPTSNEIGDGLENLAKYLRIHFDHKVLLLVDEYDSLCSMVVMNMNDTEIVKNIIQDCMGSITCLARNNENVERFVLTGISYIATLGISGLEGIVETCKFQVENDFSEFYGMTFRELEVLLNKFGKISKLKEIEDYYNGYRGNILNIFSIMHYFNHNFKLASYWKEAGSINALSEALRIPVVRSIVNKLLSGLSSEVEIDYFEKIKYPHISHLKKVMLAKDLNATNVNIYFNFLMEHGYLRISKFDKLKSKVTVKIPNAEVKIEFEENLKLYYEDINVDIAEVANCASLFDKLNTSDENNRKILPDICNSLNRIINNINFKAKNEATLHHIIFLVAFYSKHFDTFSEIRKAIKDPKRLDLLLLSTLHKLGIIIELKYNVTAFTALQQIKDRKYAVAFRKVEYNPEKKAVDYHLYMGLNMSTTHKITLCVLLNCKNYDLNKRIDYE